MSDERVLNSPWLFDLLSHPVLSDEYSGPSHSSTKYVFFSKPSVIFSALNARNSVVVIICNIYFRKSSSVVQQLFGSEQHCASVIAQHMYDLKRVKTKPVTTTRTIKTLLKKGYTIKQIL